MKKTLEVRPDILPIPDSFNSFKKRYKYFFEDTECPVYDVKFEFSKKWLWFYFSRIVFWIFGVHLFIKKGHNVALGGNTRFAKDLIESCYKEKFLEEV